MRVDESAYLASSIESLSVHSLSSPCSPLPALIKYQAKVWRLWPSSRIWQQTLDWVKIHSETLRGAHHPRLGSVADNNPNSHHNDFIKDILLVQMHNCMYVEVKCKHARRRQPAQRRRHAATHQLQRKQSCNRTMHVCCQRKAWLQRLDTQRNVRNTSGQPGIVSLQSRNGRHTREGMPDAPAVQATGVKGTRVGTEAGWPTTIIDAHGGHSPSPQAASSALPPPVPQLQQQPRLQRGEPPQRLLRGHNSCQPT